MIYNNTNKDQIPQHQIGLQIAIQLYKTRCNNPRLDLVCYDFHSGEIYLCKNFQHGNFIFDYSFKLNEADQNLVMKYGFFILFH